jgi:hypothetical protein
VFTASIDSWVYVPYTDLLETPGGITIEAWVNPSAFGAYELTPIAERWTTRPGEQSWVLGLTGQNVDPTFSTAPGPGTFLGLVTGATPGYVVFGFQKQEAGPVLPFYSPVPLQLGRWTHVAATFDGKVVCIYLTGGSTRSSPRRAASAESRAADDRQLPTGAGSRTSAATCARTRRTT